MARMVIRLVEAQCFWAFTKYDKGGSGVDCIGKKWDFIDEKECAVCGNGAEGGGGGQEWWVWEAKDGQVDEEAV